MLPGTIAMLAVIVIVIFGGSGLLMKMNLSKKDKK